MKTAKSYVSVLYSVGFGDERERTLYFETKKAYKYKSKAAYCEAFS